MDPKKKFWNDQQKELRSAITRGTETEKNITLFLQQHAMVHDPVPEISIPVSFSVEIWQDLPEPAFRLIPTGQEHSIAWNLWHLARIEDITMNVLVAGRKQLHDEEGWQRRMMAPFRHSGNAMTQADIQALSDRIDYLALRAYRAAVAARTREIVQTLNASDLKQKTSPDRLQSLLADGSVLPEATGLLDYWGGLTTAGLLLMPPTRHCFIHLNECARLKTKRAR